MPSVRINVETATRPCSSDQNQLEVVQQLGVQANSPKSLLFGVRIVWIGHSELAIQYQMRGKPGVLVRRIMGVGAIRPREYMFETPRTDFRFGLSTRLHVQSGLQIFDDGRSKL